jgi:hypothetical protein
MIKVLGRRKSDSYCRYIKISPPSIKYAQQSLTECWTRGYCVNSVYYMYFKIFFYNWMHIQYINRSNSSSLVFVYDCWYVFIRLYLPYCHDFLSDDILKAIPTSFSFHSWGNSAAFSRVPRERSRDSRKARERSRVAQLIYWTDGGGKNWVLGGNNEILCLDRSLLLTNANKLWLQGPV